MRLHMLSIEQRLSAGLDSLDRSVNGVATFVDKENCDIKTRDLAHHHLEEVNLQIEVDGETRIFSAVEIANPHLAATEDDRIYDCAILALQDPLQAIQAQQSAPPTPPSPPSKPKNEVRGESN